MVVLVLGSDDRSCGVGGEGRVDGSAGRQDADSCLRARIDTHYHSLIEYLTYLFLVGRNPQNVSSLGEDLKKQLSVNRLHSFLPESVLDHTLGQNLSFLGDLQSGGLDAGVGVLQFGGKDRHEDVALAEAFEGLVDGFDYVALAVEVLGHAFDLELDFEVSGSFGESFNHGLDFGVFVVDDHEEDAVFGLEDGVGEQAEEGFLSFLDGFLFPQFEGGVANLFGLHPVHLLTDVYSHF